MSERKLPAYYKLEVRPAPGDKFFIVVDNQIVKSDIPRKEVPNALKEYLEGDDE